MKSIAATTQSILFTVIMTVVTVLVAVQVALPTHLLLAGSHVAPALLLDQTFEAADSILLSAVDNVLLSTDDDTSDQACLDCCVGSCTSCTSMHPSPLIPYLSLSNQLAVQPAHFPPIDHPPSAFHQPVLRPPITTA